MKKAIVWCCALAGLALIALAAGCEKDTPPPPLLPPPLDPGVRPPAAGMPPAAAVPAPIAPPVAAGSGKAAFANVKPMIAGKAGDAKDGRGDLRNIWAKVQNGMLWVYMEMPGAADKNLNYRFWVSNEKKDPPSMVLVEKGLGSLQVHDGSKVHGRVTLPIDTQDGLFLKLQLKDLPPNLAGQKRLWVGHFASLDIKGAGNVTIHDEINEVMEAMPVN